MRRCIASSYGVAAIELALVAGILAGFVLIFSQVLVPQWNKIENDIVLRETFLTMNSYHSPLMVMDGDGSVAPSAVNGYVEQQLDQLADSIERMSGSKMCAMIYHNLSNPIDCDPDEGELLSSSRHFNACSTVQVEPDNCIGQALNAAITSSGCSSEKYYLVLVPMSGALGKVCSVLRLEGSVYRAPDAL